MENNIYKRKRRYIDIKQYQEIYNQQTIFKPKLKLDNSIDFLEQKLPLIKIENNKSNNIDNIPIYLVSKLLSKFNYYYQRYIENAPNKKTKINKSLQQNYNSDKDNNNEINRENEKSIIFGINTTNTLNNVNNSINNESANKKYINSELYPIVRNFGNIDPNSIFIKKILGDGNCLFRAISYFLNKTEDMHLNIRQDIYEEAFKRINILPNIEIDTERGRYKIRDYIYTIKEPNNNGGDLEISI